MQGTAPSYRYGDFQCPGCFTLNIHGTSELQARGRVELDSIWVPTPSSDTYYQSNTTDANDVASYIHFLLQTMNDTDITSLNILQNYTQAQILDYITTSSPYAGIKTNHLGGSTKLGNTCDDGVVTPNAKVCGMDNLYIAYGGIIPTHFTVNLQFGIMVAGEHASDCILVDVWVTCRRSVSQVPVRPELCNPGEVVCIFYRTSM